MVASKVSELKNLTSDISTIDEVRDRTIFVKIKSQLHSWSDVEIMSLFSEFGMIEEVKLFSVGSGFHSQIRYQTIYDSEWAYYYYYHEGWFVHQNCCEIQVYRADEVVSWNAQRIDKIKAANVVSDTPEVMSACGFLEETVRHDELMNQEEDSSQFVERIQPKSAKEPSGLAAHKVFEEMPRSTVTGEAKLLDEIMKKNGQLVDGSDLEAPPSGSAERLADVNTPEEGTPRDAIATNHALELEFSKQARMKNGVVCVICFDPGGYILLLRDELAQSEKNEPTITKKFSHLVAHQLFDKIPEPEGCNFPKLFTEIRETKMFGVAFLNPDEYFDPRIMSFDPGGLVMMNSFGSLIANAEFHSSHCVDTMIFDLGGSVEEFSASLEAYDCEVHAYFCWSVGRIRVSSYQLNNPAVQAFWNTYCSGNCYGIVKLAYMAHDRWTEMIESTKIPDELTLAEFVLKVALESSAENFKSCYFKIIQVCDQRYASLLLSKNDITKFQNFLKAASPQEEIVINYIHVLCFDPGGGSIILPVSPLHLMKFVPHKKGNTSLFINEKLPVEMRKLFGVPPFVITMHQTDPHNLRCDVAVHGAQMVVFDPSGNIEGNMMKRLSVSYGLSSLVVADWFQWVAYMLLTPPTGVVDECELLKLFDIKGGLICDLKEAQFELHDKNSNTSILIFLYSTLVSILVVQRTDLVKFLWLEFFLDDLNLIYLSIKCEFVLVLHAHIINEVQSHYVGCVNASCMWFEMIQWGKGFGDDTSTNDTMVAVPMPKLVERKYTSMKFYQLKLKIWGCTVSGHMLHLWICLFLLRSLIG